MLDIIKIANKIKENRGTLYLVGGSVRDEILGKVPCDEDYLVVGMTSHKFNEIFNSATPRGKFFEVYDLEGREFAMARTETKIGRGHKEFKVNTGELITLEQDLSRRDITINCIAKDVLTGEIIDIYGGIKDLENRTIRAVTKSFSEDPLRVYRVARLAAQLEFKVESNTVLLMNSLKEELNTLSKERIFTEFRKALSTNKPSIFFEVLRQADLLQIHFKEIYNLIGVLQPEQYHPEGDGYEHTMVVIDKSTYLTDSLEVRYACLVHDIGKSITPKHMYPHHYGHDINGVKLVGNLSSRIGVPKSWKKCGETACKEHMIGGIFYKMNPKKKVSFIQRVDKTLLGLNGLQIVVNADKSRSTNIKPEHVNFEIIGNKCLKEINGKYIKQKYNISSGIQFANKLYEERVKWMKNKF